MKRLFILSGLTFLLLSMGAWLFRHEIMVAVFFPFSSKEQYLNSGYRDSLEKVFPRIEEDSVILKKHSVFSSSRGIRDAAPELNSRVRWSTMKDATLSFSPEVATLWQQTSWLKWKPTGKSAFPDTSWMKKLHDFDHWSFDSQGPLYGGGRSYQIDNAPSLEYSDFVNWGKLRLIQGRTQGALLPALRDVRQLARLIFTHENTVASMVAIRLLKLEAEMIESLDSKMARSVRWRTIPREDLERAIRFFKAISLVLDPRLSEIQVIRLTSLPVGRCQLAHEGIHYWIGFRRLMRSENEAFTRHLDQFVQKTEPECRSSFMRSAWQDPAYQWLFKSGENVLTAVQRLLSDTPEISRSFTSTWMLTIEELERNPALSTMIGYHVLAIGKPYPFRAYEQ